MFSSLLQYLVRGSGVEGRGWWCRVSVRTEDIGIAEGSGKIINSTRVCSIVK